jgi:hypothetical protein
MKELLEDMHKKLIKSLEAQLEGIEIIKTQKEEIEFLNKQIQYLSSELSVARNQR